MVAEEATSRICYRIESKDVELTDVPIMVSVIKDGEVIWQGETNLGVTCTPSSLPAGVYDVRFEGEGIQTLVKRGIHLIQNQVSIIAPIVAGQGVHIVEYAAGSLAREEVAACLIKLEASVAVLQKASEAK